jgi:putative peptidoglycan lipid II flippase
MAAGALVSRATGFVRTAALGAVLGAGLAGDAYATATMLPGIVYEVLLGGTLAGILVPVLVRAKNTDHDRGQAYAQRLLTLTTLVLAAVTAAATLMVPFLVSVLTTGDTTSGSRSLVTWWSYLVIPTVFCYGLGAVLTAVLNARGHFATPTWAPILNNLILITAAGLFLALPTAAHLTPDTITTTQISLIGAATLLGVVAQTAGLWPAARRVGLRWRWRFDFRSLQVGELARLGGWLMCSVAPSQIAVFAAIALLKAAGDHGGPGPFIYNNGWLMLMMGYGIAALPVITALQPRISTTASHNHAEALKHLATGTRIVAVTLAPATVALVVFAQPLATVLFAWHRYTPAQAADTGTVIAVAGCCLIPYAINQAQTFAFYALGDARTPALLNLPVVAVRIGLYFTAYQTVPTRYVAAAVMAANGVTYLIAALAGWWLLRRRGLRGPGTATAPTTTKALTAALCAGIPTVAILWALRTTLGDGKVPSLVALVVAGTVLVTTYLLVARGLRIPEIRQLLARVRGRISKR